MSFLIIHFKTNNIGLSSLLYIRSIFFLVCFIYYLSKLFFQFRHCRNVPDGRPQPIDIVETFPIVVRIRPAPGYSTSPDHSEEKKIFALLDAENNINVSSELLTCRRLNCRNIANQYQISTWENRFSIIDRFADFFDSLLTSDIT
ncbi:MAG: hypothetical protein LBE04_05285 [Prevotellaceae bacterium]|nr:hypothetical protein [Prevotellaceae bacterium]